MVPRLLAISSPEVRPGPAWRQWCSALEAAGVDGLQVRRKDASDRELLELACEARAHTTGAVTILVNARLDIAIAARADGVHLPASGLPVSRLRAALAARAAPPMLFGRSTHNLEDVRRARDEGADFVCFGPVFPTPSKAGTIPVQGLDGLAHAAACGLPVLALGGIDATNAGQALDCGAWGLAAIRWFAEPAAGGPGFAALRRRWQAE